MRKVRVTAEWRSHHEVEVPDDWDGEFDSLPEEALDEVRADIAELVNWEFREGQNAGL